MKWKIFYQDEYNLTTTEQYILNFIENNKEKSSKASISQLAKIGGFSISSLSKFVRKLGFNSYKEMQMHLIIEIEKRKNQKIKNIDPLIQIAQEISWKYALSIERTIRELNINTLYKLINCLKKQKEIYTFGIGSSDLAAKELANNLMSIGIKAQKPDSIHELFKFINLQNFNNVTLVLFSKSLLGQEIKIIRQICQDENINVFIITSNYGIIKNVNEEIINIRTSEQEKRISALSSKIAQQFIVDIITNFIGIKKENQIFKTFNSIWRKNI